MELRKALHLGFPFYYKGYQVRSGREQRVPILPLCEVSMSLSEHIVFSAQDVLFSPAVWFLLDYTVMVDWLTGHCDST